MAHDPEQLRWRRFNPYAPPTGHSTPLDERECSCPDCFDEREAGGEA